MILYRLPREEDLNAVKPVNRDWIITLSAVVAFSLAMFAAVYLLYGDISFARTSLRATPDVPNNASTWGAFSQITPIPYTTPLPEPISTVIDGYYAKIDPSPPQWWTCRRCADYRLSGGIWRLQFDKGVVRILYDVTGWHSLASFTVSGDQMHIFNDPYCPGEMGLYRWQLTDGALGLQVIEDSCAFRLRGENISNQVWSACPLSGGTAGVGDNQEIPAGCALNPVLPVADAATDSALKVSVYSGDSRFFEKPPDLFALANSAEAASPEGIQVTYSQKSVSFGLNRVLWWGGEWIEACTELLFSSMGVQFLGESQMGWARLLFDGEVIWQGDVSEIGVEKGRYGGFVEVSGFTPGRHTIRVESMGFDYRPVTVASFGFSYQDGVEVAAN
jgi:hypothetical protein